jgi:hypothetical protein
MTSKLLIKAALFFGSVACLVILVYSLWNPGKATENSFDIGNNGLWVGHQWLTGYNVKTRLPVSVSELDSFVTLLNVNRIKYVYIHAGPISISGTVPDKGRVFFSTITKNDSRYRLFTMARRINCKT